MTYEFPLPDIGEGLVEGEVVRWHVKEGDAIKESQPLVTVLTDKAEVEIPSPKTGTIVKLMAQPGEKVKVHAPLVTFDIAGAAVAAAPVNGGAKPALISAAPPVPAAPAPMPAPSTASAPASAAPVGTIPPGSLSPAAGPVQALPAVRKLAQDLKVDLAAVLGTGPGGRITEEDVRKASGSPVKAAPLPSFPPAPETPSAAPGLAPETAATAGGADEERIPFVGIRRRTAEKMALSARTVAAVTHMDEADFTPLVILRAELRGEAEKRGVRLTFMPFILKALVKTLKMFPNLNAVLNELGGAIVRKRHYNIGIATSAEQGLVVPVIKEVDKKDLWALAGDVNRLADKVRANRIDVSELQGGTFTITNIGPIGGLFATPILNYPEVGILGVMKLQKRPVVKDGGIHIRDMINLVLTFDHRVLDGAEAAQFMNTLVKHLENPRTLL